MNKFTVIIACMTMSLIPQDVAADQFVTTFSATYTVNGTRFVASVPTASDRVLVLPPQLSDWNCRVTPRYLSTDGSSTYHNITCMNSTAVVGTSIACPVNREGTDNGSFFLRSGGVNLEVFGFCMTKHASNTDRAPGSSF
jgi:hypothetical protein